MEGEVEVRGREYGKERRGRKERGEPGECEVRGA